MRPFVRVKMLTSEDYKQLRVLAKSRKLPAGKMKRAKIVLSSNQGYTAREIGAKLDCNKRTALRWINRFNKYGVAGLEEGPCEGSPRVYGPEDVGAVIQATLTPPHELALPFASWTLDRLVAYLSEEKGVGMGHTRVAEVLSREGLRWKKQEGWFGERVDPEVPIEVAIPRGSVAGDRYYDTISRCAPSTAEESACSTLCEKRNAPTQRTRDGTGLMRCERGAA